MMPHDFTDKLITVSKTGESFVLDIEGLEQNEENYFCKYERFILYYSSVWQPAAN